MDPSPSEKLPIDAVLEDIQASLENDTRLVLSAPPGAGKTTRVPLALLDAEWAVGQRILMLEPRRIAARTAAERLAYNLGEAVGEQVGYRIRGEVKVSKATRIEVITEGILTRMLQSDPELPGVAAILFDEIHERSIHSDLGMALALEVQDALRDDLRLVAMSATVDVARFSALMGDCPIVESLGKTFPIQTNWLEQQWHNRNARTPRHRAFTQAARSLTLKAVAESQGDVLVFLPGVGEISAVRSALNSDTHGCRVETLYGAMTLADQRAVLSPTPDGARRIVLATSIAETSLTVPGVRAVIDTGLARRPRTDPATGMGRLETVPVSMAEADQRRGRAGRLGPGVCYRMWTKGQEGAMERYPLPEILTADITALVLELAQWGLDDPGRLAFLDAPRENAVFAARALLIALGALEASGRITDHGRLLLTKPLHPRLAHMMEVAQGSGFGAEAALIAAVLGARPGQLERDVPGGDLSILLQCCASGPANSAIRGVRDEAKRLSGDARWDSETVIREAPELVASAYPDRIALRRHGERPRFLLSNGRGAFMSSDHPLAGQRLMVATDLEDGRDARIRSAIAVDERTIRAQFSDRIHWAHSVEWSSRSRRVETRKREMLGAIALKDEIWQDAPAEKIGAALADGIQELGLDALDWNPKASRFRQRVAWANQIANKTLFPDLSDQGLIEKLELWLMPHLAGLRTVQATTRLDLLGMLKGQFDWGQLQQLERIAPEQFVTPAGSNRPIDYAGDTPQVSVRIQEMYGTAAHPCLGAPPIPILFNLLSPADRPVQTTADLPNFWRGSYEDVRRDLRIRYPKHDWPTDPAHASATLGSKKQGPRKDTKN